MAKRTADAADLATDEGSTTPEPKESGDTAKAADMCESEEKKKKEVEETQTSSPNLSPTRAPEWKPPMVPLCSTSPEARARLLGSELGHLSVKHLKERLAALGAGEHEIAACAEKEELVELLDELTQQEPKQTVQPDPTFEETEPLPPLVHER
eukprot:gb/GFBE01016775.1/.p1 GENE.gb/GFBE01016775.1/~~gb/GFBE01016775.1/.p1  ORF type:complete len:153 (+),score=51.92 gb/GFBE01016775.1/:1-459(+)